MDNPNKDKVLNTKTRFANTDVFKTAKKYQIQVK